MLMTSVIVINRRRCQLFLRLLKEGIMLLSFGLLFLVGLVMAAVCQKLRLPRIIGMLFGGIVLGPFALNLLDADILNISADLRQMALIIILIKAGLSLNIKDLKQVGRPAVLMSFLPAGFEIIAYLIFAPMFFGISHTEALLMGSVLAAVSPAIVVPRMVNLIEEKYGTKKSIPQLILAGASCDDVFVIVLFSTFTAIVAGQGVNVAALINIPASIVSGIFFGSVVGVMIGKFFEYFHNIKKSIRNSSKVIIILAISFIIISLEHLTTIPFSGILAVVSMACVYKLKSRPIIVGELSQKFGKLWIAAEIILFMLVGATVDTGYIVNTGVSAVAMIFIGLSIRTIGVVASLLRTKLNFKERVFCIFAYLPKATVQAAIGSVPLSLGLPCGNIILAVAVLSIVITAPLGAIAIDFSYKKLLEKE